MSKALQEELDSLNIIWKSQSKIFVRTKPEAELDPNSTLNSQAFSNLATTLGKFKSLDARLTGSADGKNVNLKKWDSKIKNLKADIGNNKQELLNEININNASDRLKTDKYNYNSETYIQASFYVLSISTLTFFIYKQLKQ